MSKRLKPVGWILGAVVLVGATAVYFRKRSSADEDHAPRTAAVERRDVVQAVSATGVLEPLTTVDVKANVAGEITELDVDRGDYVKAGDLIARIDPTESQSAYEESEADVTAALARVRETSADLLRQQKTTTAQVNAAEDATQSAAARTAQAEGTLEFQKQTTEAGIDTSEQALEAARAKQDEAHARAKVQPELTKASIAGAEADLQAAQQTLQRLKEATHPQENASAKAALDAAKVSVDNDTKSLTRLQHLLAQGYVSRQQVEDAEKQLADSKERYQSANAAYEPLQKKHATELQEAEAHVAQAQAALNSAKAGQVEIAVLQQEANAADAAVRQAQAALAAAKANQEQVAVRAQELRAAQADAQQARSQLSVAQANLLSAQVSAQQVAQAKAQARRVAAELENARKNLSYTTIVAPRAGLVIDRYVEQGTVITSGRSSVTAGTNIVTLADVRHMFVLADVDEADIGQVKIGQRAEITVETFPDQPVYGTVTQIYPKGDEVENVTVFRVRAELEKPDPRLRPGMTADVSIIIARQPNVLAVPNEAVFEQGGKSFVETFKDGKTEQVPVEVGLTSFEWTEIKSGLQEGEQVVLGPAMPTMAGGPPGAGARPNSRQQMSRMSRMAGGRR
jgi:HlyD family secretion protein